MGNKNVSSAKGGLDSVSPDFRAQAYIIGRCRHANNTLRGIALIIDAYIPPLTKMRKISDSVCEPETIVPLKISDMHSPISDRLHEYTCVPLQSDFKKSAPFQWGEPIGYNHMTGETTIDRIAYVEPEDAVLRLCNVSLAENAATALAVQKDAEFIQSMITKRVAPKFHPIHTPNKDQSQNQC